MYITDRYIALFSCTGVYSLDTLPFLVYDRNSQETQAIKKFTVNGKELNRLTGLQRIFHNKYAILNLNNGNDLYAVCLMDMDNPVEVIPLITSTNTFRCTYAGYVLLDDDTMLFMLSLNGISTTYGTAIPTDSNLYRIIYKRSTKTIVDSKPVLHYIYYSPNNNSIYGAMFHQINDTTLLVITSIYTISTTMFISGLVTKDDFDGMTIKNNSWLYDSQYEMISRPNVNTGNDIQDIPNVYLIGEKNTSYPRRRYLYSMVGGSALYTANGITEYGLYPYATASIDDKNIYFMFIDRSSRATMIRVTVDIENKQLTHQTYAPDTDTTYSYTTDSFTANLSTLLAYDSNACKLYKTYHGVYNGGFGVYAAVYGISTQTDFDTQTKREYGDYAYEGVKKFDSISPTGMSNVNYIPFNGKLYAGYNQRNVTDKRFVPVVAVE